MSGEPYGNRGHNGPGAVPEDETRISFRFGIRVESDMRGPQEIAIAPNQHTPTELAYAHKLAKRAAEAHRSALRELGIRDAVVPWVQRVVRRTTFTFEEHIDLDPFT